jgi:hypothetical protein
VTLQFNGGARTPGPLGRFPGGVGGRVPGPIGRPLWDEQTTSPTPGAVAKAPKKTPMPLPTKDQDGKNVHVFTWPLYNSSKKGPAYDDVKQAPGIANCPVGAILAALAFTPAGNTVIHRMVSEKTDNVSTDLSGLPPGALSDPPSGTTISSARYFTVKIAGDSIDVSDVLYTDDHDSGWSPLYIRDPSDRSIWAAVIEKALAVKLGSYENFDALNISANDFWEKILGAKPGFIEIKADTPIKDIVAAAEKSTRVPSIGASKPNGTDVKVVTEFHGYAMLGVQGSKIRLYDAAKAKTVLISPADFRHDFQAILFRN